MDQLTTNIKGIVKIPRDLREVKNKVILNLTKRQLLTIMPGVIIGIISFFVLLPQVGQTLATILMMTIMSPFFAVGLFQKDGLYLEEILKYRSTWKKRPKIRMYASRNTWREGLDMVSRMEMKGGADVRTKKR